MLSPRNPKPHDNQFQREPGLNFTLAGYAPREGAGSLSKNPFPGAAERTSGQGGTPPVYSIQGFRSPERKLLSQKLERGLFDPHEFRLAIGGSAAGPCCSCLVRAWSCSLSVWFRSCSRSSSLWRYWSSALMGSRRRHRWLQRPAITGAMIVARISTIINVSEGYMVDTKLSGLTMWRKKQESG